MITPEAIDELMTVIEDRYMDGLYSYEELVIIKQFLNETMANLLEEKEHD